MYIVYAYTHTLTKCTNAKITNFLQAFFTDGHAIDLYATLQANKKSEIKLK